jgi:hypothetical protein
MVIVALELARRARPLAFSAARSASAAGYVEAGACVDDDLGKT